MLRRLLWGLVKGVVLGATIGALLHFGLAATPLAGALAYVVYGAVAAIAGVFAGELPWKPGAWIGALIKAILGIGIGALVYFLGSKFLNIPVGGLAGAPDDTVLSQFPLLFAPIVGGVFSGLIELDDGGEKPQEEKKSGVRIADLPEEENEEIEIERQDKTSEKARR